jgi:hypothetical protein
MASDKNRKILLTIRISIYTNACVPCAYIRQQSIYVIDSLFYSISFYVIAVCSTRSRHILPGILSQRPRIDKTTFILNCYF